MSSFDFTYIDRNLIDQTALALQRSAVPENQKLAQYLEGYDPRRSPLVLLGIAANDVKVVRHFTTDSAYERRSQGLQASLGPAKWGIEFIKLILANLRKAICGGTKAKSDATLAALAAMIVSQFHISISAATGLAVMCLMALGRATKDAFCKMTDSEVLAALAENR
jgi:hypothetical protein